MSQPEQDAGGTQGVAARAPWERPTLTVIGNLKDLVQGFGKTGPNADSDLHSPGAKSGVG